MLKNTRKELHELVDFAYDNRYEILTSISTKQSQPNFGGENFETYDYVDININLSGEVPNETLPFNKDKVKLYNPFRDLERLEEWINYIKANPGNHVSDFLDDVKERISKILGEE